MNNGLGQDIQPHKNSGTRALQPEKLSSPFQLVKEL